MRDHTVSASTALLHASTVGDESDRLTQGTCGVRWRLVSYVVSIAVPAALAFALEQLPAVVSLAVVGGVADSAHVGGAGLALTITNLTLWGGSSVLGAMETLVPQAFGAGNNRLVGAVLQRGLVQGTLLAVLVSLLWLPIKALLVAVGLGHSAADTSTFLLYSMPGNLPLMWYNALLRFSNGQEVVWPPVVQLALTNVAHLGISLAAVHGVGAWGGLGYVGAPVALGITRWVMFGSLALALAATGGVKGTWFGCSASEALSGSGHRLFLALGLPAAGMVVCETAGYELLTVMSGYLPDGHVSLAAMAVVSNVYLFCWTGFLGLNAAASILVGQYLGAGHPHAAKVTAWYTLALTAILSGLTGLSLHLAARPVTALLASGPQVQSLAESTMRLAAWVNVVDTFQCTACGVLMGIGRPGIGTAANLAGYFLVSAPLAWYLGFHRDLRLLGLFGGLLGAVSVVAIIVTANICATDWHRASKTARQAALEEEHANAPARSLSDSGAMDEFHGLVSGSDGEAGLVPGGRRIPSVADADIDLRSLRDHSQSGAGSRP